MTSSEQLSYEYTRQIGVMSYIKHGFRAQTNVCFANNPHSHSAVYTKYCFRNHFFFSYTDYQTDGCIFFYLTHSWGKIVGSIAFQSVIVPN